MYRKIFIPLAFFTILAACSKEDPVVVKTTTDPDSTREPTLVEQQHKKEIDKYVEFALPHEKVMINLEMVPILNAYLKSAKNQKKTIKQMHMVEIRAKDKSFFLLEFSCHQDECSYLLLNKNKEKPGLLVADLAKLVQTNLSPDKSKIFLQFNRKSSLPKDLSNIVAINIDKWERIPLTNQTNNLKVLNYTWPIISAVWKDNQTITVSLPNVIEPTNEQLLQWQSDKKEVITIELSENTD